ncbi:MAG: RNA 3'-terminal phosphate cyclase [Candidatus Aenigmatarchaeota archaeon]
MNMIEIDGSHLEGGGQILRTSVALSALTGKPCRVTNIRAGRCNPGMQAQHLEAVKAVAELCNANMKGAKLNSTTLEFEPGKIRSKTLEIKIPTAGSIALVLQSLMIACTRHNIDIKFIGGATNGKWASSVNYLKFVLFPLLKKMGCIVDIEVEKYGYYPKGGADVSVRVGAAELKPIVLLECGNILSIHGISHASQSLKQSSVAERQKAAAETVLAELDIKSKIDVLYPPAICPGSGVDLWAITEHSVLGGDAIGERNKSAESVGKEAASKLLAQLKSSGAVDEHSEDQLLPYMALANGESAIHVPHLTNHTKTNIWVIEKFLPVRFSIDENKKIVRCMHN